MIHQNSPLPRVILTPCGAHGRPPVPAATAVTKGGAATVWNSGNVLYAKDAKDARADKHSVYGGANNTMHRLGNWSVRGAAVSRSCGFTVTAVQACVNIQCGPDNCSSWR